MTTSNRRRTGVMAVVGTVAALMVPVSAQTAAFPDVIALPDGFFPEGIAIGQGHQAFTGSLADGAIFRVDLRTGVGETLVQGRDGGISVGMDYGDRSGLLFVAEGFAGTAAVYDGETGALVERLDLGPGFINDVVVTRTAAYFTNSFAPEIYEVPLGAGGAVVGSVNTIQLSGEFVFVPGQFNANGIEATADGGTLVLAGSAAAELYTVDPTTGVATEIVLDVPVAGDGLTLLGRTLYANENSLDRIAVVELDPGLSSGSVVDYLTSDAYDVPTTSAAFGSSLYAVNARFGTPPTPTTSYDIVRVDRR